MATQYEIDHPERARAQSEFWNTDMAASGQALYADPALAVQAAAIPAALLASQEAHEEDARAERGGFLSGLSNTLANVWGSVDGAMSSAFGGAWDATKTFGSWAWTPVDRTASAIYWVYSEAISQPLSTYMLQSAKGSLRDDWWGTMFSGDSWSESYGQAEHTSPGRVFFNTQNVMEARGEGDFISDLTGAEGDVANMTPEEIADVKRNSERFLYDNDFWADRGGLTYEIGTGALDFLFSVGLDPAAAGVTAVSAGVKAGRATKLTTAATEKSRAVLPATKAGAAVGKLISRKPVTPAEAVTMPKIQEAFDWMADGATASTNKTGFEIAQHPMWGKGRNRNPEADSLSEFLSVVPRDAMEDVFRFAGRDNSAVGAIKGHSDAAVVALGNLQDNRTLVDSLRFDRAELKAYIKQEKAGAPVTPLGAHTTEQATELRAFAKDYLSATSPSTKIVKTAKEWRRAKLDATDVQLREQQRTVDAFKNALGSLDRSLDDFAPGQSNIFGTLGTVYRTGPLALRDVTKAADRAVVKATRGVGDKYDKPGNFVAQTYRRGFYTPTTRLISAFGTRIPEGFVDHGGPDAVNRVADMLKQVRGLGGEERLRMIREYTQAGDKVSRSLALKKINEDVITHLVTRVNNLDPELGVALSRIIEGKITETLDDLRGVPTEKGIPGRQRFTAAQGENGKFLDTFDEDGATITGPVAKTQLSAGDALLPIRDIDRLIQRHSGLMRTLRSGPKKQSVADMVTDLADGFNTIWKASTLLRGGYVLRSMSEEQVASMVKFGILSTLADAGEGGWDFMRNRGTQIQAFISPSKKAYVPTSGAGASSRFAAINLSDPEVVNAAKARERALRAEIATTSDPLKKAKLETQLEAAKVHKVKVDKSYPLALSVISDERKSLSATETQIKNLEKRLANYQSKPTLTANQQGKMNDIQAQLDDALNRAADHANVIEEFMDYADEILKVSKDATGKRLGERMQKSESLGKEVPGAFSREWPNPLDRSQVTSANANAAIFARVEGIHRNRVIRTGQWNTLTKEDQGYMEAWRRAINLQWGQDDLHLLVAKDPTLGEAKKWLKTPEGRYHRSLLGHAGRDEERLLITVQANLDKYIPEATGLRAKMIAGDEVTEADLRAAIREEDFPMIHGEEINTLVADSRWQSANAYFDRVIESGFNRFSTIPNDIMARQPIFLRAYNARFEEFVAHELSYRATVGKANDELTMDELEKIRDKAASFARKDISKVVYDPQRTSATEALRFATPFLSAHIDGLQRWSGLIAERPQMLTTAGKIYNAPVAANMVTDENGFHVGQDGYAEVRDPNTGEIIERRYVPIDKRTITFRLPWETENLKNVGAVTSGGIPIKIQSLNTILPGDPWFHPGVGPLVQVPANEIAKSSPQFGEFFQWAKVLPYGPTGSTGKSLLPKYIRDAYDWYTADDPDNESYQRAYLAEVQRQHAVHANGGPAPDMKLARENAKHFMFMQILEAWASPAQTQSTPLSNTPYQFFIDQYSALKAVNPETADSEFLARYGSDYFIFTASVSKSMGIASTISADATAEKYGDLIEADPDMASLIIGDVYNKGEFSSSVYRKQMEEMIAGQRVRQKISTEEAVARSQANLGWEKWGKYSDLMDAALIRSGFKSYSQKGAENFAEIKRDLVQKLGEKYPAWLEDFSETNTRKIPMRIDSMKRIVSDESLMNDPMRSDLKVLKTYLALRDALKAQLNERGLRSLSFGVGDPAQLDVVSKLGRPTGAAADIGLKLRGIQAALINQDTRFASLFHRYLEGDDLS